MNEFKQLAHLVQVVSEMEGIDPDHKRYLAGFRFGVEAAGEVGEFEPWPQQFAGIVLDDPYLVGMFDGRAGNINNLVGLASPEGWPGIRAKLHAATQKV